MLAVTSFAAADMDISDIKDLNLLSVANKDEFSDVLTLINQLRLDSGKQIKIFTESSTKQNNQLAGICTQQKRAWAAKNAEYLAQLAVVNGFKSDISEAKARIASIDAVVAGNKKKAADLKTKRCEANALFIQHLMEHKQSLEAIEILRDILENDQKEVEKRAKAFKTTPQILSQLGIHQRGLNRQQRLEKVLKGLTSLFSVMPKKMQTSFLEMQSKFDIDPDFDMLKHVSTSVIQDKKFFAPKKFAVASKPATLVKFEAKT
jgi:hypothetical protein